MKVGNQWRFPREEVLNQLSAPPVARRNQESSQPTISPSPVVTSVIPLPCVQAIQDVFAEMVNVGVLTIDTRGVPVTEISNCNRFCRLILASKQGRESCVSSWRKLVTTGAKQPEFIECHAGLHCACARIEVGGYVEAAIVAGQFYVTGPAPGEKACSVRQLAHACDINPDELLQAAEDIPVLSDQTQPRIGVWLKTVAETFGRVGTDRAAYRDRLRQIAQMSMIDPA
jgi:ligand-binding sensor protein